MKIKSIFTKEKFLLAAKIAFLDILYYLILAGIIYLGILALNKSIPAIMESASSLADLSLIENPGAFLSSETGQYINAAKAVESLQNYFLVLYTLFWMIISVMASLIKGAEYAKLNRERYSLVHFWKYLAFNLLWRGLFLGLFLLSIIIIKPEMMFIFWIIIMGLFFCLTPLLYLGIKKEKTLFLALAGSLGKSIKKIPAVFFGYVALAAVFLALFSLAQFLPPIFLILFAFVFMFLASEAKIILADI